jgi:hypothetical protein
MATLNTLQLLTFTNINDTGITGTPPVLQEIAAASDSTSVNDVTNSTHTGVAQLTLEAVNADLGNMDTLFIQLRYSRSTGTQTNSWDSLSARVFKSDGTTPLTNALTVVSGPITTTTPTNSSVVQFTGLDTAATKAEWEAAVVHISFAITRSKGGDSILERVFAAEITGTYTISAGEPVTVALTPATSTFAAQALTPSLSALATALTPATATAAAQALSPTLAALVVPLTPATGSIAAQALTPTLGALATAITPATATIAAQALSPQIAGSGVEIALTPATASLAAQTISPQLAAAVIEMTSAAATAAAQALSPSLGALAIGLTPATATIAASVLSPQIAGGGDPFQTLRVRQVNYVGVW